MEEEPVNCAHCGARMAKDDEFCPGCGGKQNPVGAPTGSGLLERYDFNRSSGYWAAVLVSIGISLLFFSLAYMIEGVGWITEFSTDANELYLDVGWNWIDGSGIAFLVTLVLFGIARSLLKSNRSSSDRRSPLFGKLDLNQRNGLLGLVLLAVSFTFFFNGGLYRIEAANWFYAAAASSQSWFLDEASKWIMSSTIMIIIGIVLSATGWVMIAMQWRRE